MKYPDEVWFGGIKVKKRTILTLFLTIIMLMGIFTINVGAYKITQRGTFFNGQQELIWGYVVLLEQSDGTAAGTKLYFEDQYENASDYGTRVNNYFATFTSKPGENGTGSAHVMNGDDDIGINYTGSGGSAYSIVNFPPFSDYENEIGSNAIRPKSGFEYSHYTIEGLNGWENVKFYPGDALPLDCLAKGYIYQGIEYAGGDIPQYMYSINLTVVVHFKATTSGSAPEIPTEGELSGLLENVVTVDCVNTLAGHADTTYGLIAGSYTIGSLATDNTGALPTYTVGVTVAADKYIEQYSTDKDEKHILNPGSDAEKVITLSWNEDAWEVSTTLPVTFEAMCAPKPEAPTEAELPEIFGEGAVEITCVTVESIHEQRTIAYDVIFGSVGEVVTHENPDGLSSYTLDIAIEADKYISKFSEDTKVAHIQIANENRLVKTNLTWDPYEAKWNPTENTELPVIFHIICTSETGGDDFIGKVYIQRLMLTKPSSGSPVPINEASSVTYRVVGLPTDPAKRENITIDVTVNDIKVDEKYIFCSSSNNGTEEYYFMMDSDLLNEAIGDQTFPAIITVRVQVTYTTELNKTLELAAEDFSYMVKAYRTGFGFGRLRP